MLLTATACHRSTVVVTGVVTTNDVVVSSQVTGQLARLDVTEGDSVRQGELLAMVRPDELRADSAYYAETAQGTTSQVDVAAASLRFQQRQTADQVRQAEATLAAAAAQQTAARSDADLADSTLQRTSALLVRGFATAQDVDQARTADQAAHARLDAAARQVDAAAAGVKLAEANAEQDTIRLRQLDLDRHQYAAAAAQRRAADVRLDYTELRAPINGIVDVRAAREGEVITPGQPVVTLVNPDDLWVRADIEESYISDVRLGDTLTVRLPSGEARTGTVFFRGVDASFATRRDVSRSKRDIKTFEIRIRVDNRDRRLALGMTAYVLLPVR
jgi:multidrug resistance efflux pump